MSGIVFGCIVPHPPLLFPEVGGSREQEIPATRRAMEELSQRLASTRPDTVVIISPHGKMLFDSMGVAAAAEIRGTMRNWGAQGSDLDFKNDPDVIDALKKESTGAGIPLASIGGKEYNLDHGVMVPMHFLVEGMENNTLVPLTFSMLSLDVHFEFGKALQRAALRTGKRIAVVASGDLSHRLLPDAPAGYDPAGKIFDEKLRSALAEYNMQAILNLDSDLISKAGECGLRSIVILLGALDSLDVKPEVLSYEGPFGVGYLVASFELQDEDRGKMHPLPMLAKATVESYIQKKELPVITEPSPEMREKAGVFVSIKMHGKLRGCIGTFEPGRPNVAEEIQANAISAATSDPRFPPVSREELPYLKYSVDVLTQPEPVDDINELDPVKYGVIVESGHRRGLLLPDLEGVDTVEKQVNISRQKAGITPDEPVKLYRFEVKRYK